MDEETMDEETTRPALQGPATGAGRTDATAPAQPAAMLPRCY
ncbi:protein of unknown function [Paraburkholderia kururiensis]